ncbi:MAG: thioesterase family protein [Actinobacteria bacterium]|nr:thioesterase family protein [Actinomycetota bacterium]
MAPVPDSFFLADGDRFVATELTRGPWDPGAQHAGPPSALIGRALERLPDGEGMRLARLTVEILGPVPIGTVAIEARVARPGRRVQMVEAELEVGGETRIRARGWRLREAALELPAAAIVADPPPPPPEQASGGDFFPTDHEHGYHTGMETRFAEGGWVESGPARAWLRMRYPLIAGEEPTPLERTLIAADIGNGISSALDFRRWIFINVDLTVQLERLPVGEWVCIDAVTRPHPDAIGASDSVLYDRQGRIGRALQTLVFSERPEPFQA